MPRALNGRALGKAGEYWKSPLLRVAVRQEASTAGRSSFGPPSLLAFQQLCADGIDERQAAAEYLRCSATARVAGPNDPPSQPASKKLSQQAR